MNVELNMDLVRSTKRSPRAGGGLSFDERMAVNWFWRQDVKATILAKVFRVSKNTIYYSALTGLAQSYPAKTAVEINETIDQLGMGEVERLYVKPWMIKAVNAELEVAAQLILNRQRRREAANPPIHTKIAKRIRARRTA